MLVKFLSAVSVVALLSSPAMAGGKKGAAKNKCKAEEKWDAKAKKCVAKAEEAAKDTAAPAETAPVEAPVGE